MILSKILTDIFVQLDYRSPLFGSVFAILSRPLPFTMNTATIFLTCQKDPVFQGLNQHSASSFSFVQLLTLLFSNKF